MTLVNSDGPPLLRARCGAQGVQLALAPEIIGTRRRGAQNKGGSQGNASETHGRDVGARAYATRLGRGFGL